MRARTGPSKHFGQPKETHLPAGKHTAARRLVALRSKVERGMCSGPLFALYDNILGLLRNTRTGRRAVQSRAERTEQDTVYLVSLMILFSFAALIFRAGESRPRWTMDTHLILVFCPIKIGLHQRTVNGKERCSSTRTP